MRSAAELGKTIGVLLALWAVLGVIGWIGSAFPPGGLAVEPAHDAQDAATLEDAGLAADDAFAALEDEDAPSLEPDAGRTEVLSIARVCPTVTSPVWALGELVGDAREEIVVGCAAGIDVLAWPRGGVPTRVAHVRGARAGRLLDAAIGDVDADGLNDLVLSLDGGLVRVPREASGGFGPPQTLAPGRNGPLVLGALDASPGLDVAVVHGVDPRAEIWLYRGGPTPVRADTTPAPLSTTALAVIDLDVDGHLDLVAVGAQQILLAFGDSRASIARTRSLTPGGRGATSFDADGDGALEIVVEREGVACVLDPAPALAEAGDCAPLPSLEGLRALRATGGTVLGVRQPDVVAWSAADGLTTLATLATTRFGLHRVARDEDGLVLLGSSEALADPSSPEAAPSRMVELARAGEGALLTERESADGRTDVVDAPLVLSIEIGDPDAP